MLRNIFLGTVLVAMVFGAAPALATDDHRQPGQMCRYMGNHSDAAQDCVYINEEGISNNCTNTEITVICPVVAHAMTSYSGKRVNLQLADNNSSYNFSGQVFAKSPQDWAWTNCGSVQYSSGTGDNKYLWMSICLDSNYLVDYYGARVVIPRKTAGGAMSFIYGYYTETPP